MLDFGWSETFLILVIALFAIGPDDIPKVMVAIGRVFRRLQYIKYAFSQQFEDIMRVADLDDLRASVNFEEGRNIKRATRDADFNEGNEDAEYLGLDDAPKAQGGDDDTKS